MNNKRQGTMVMTGWWDSRYSLICVGKVNIHLLVSYLIHLS